MKIYHLLVACSIAIRLIGFSSLNGAAKELPEEMQKIMHQTKYKHAMWGIYVKDLQTGEVLFDFNSNKFFSPASTTKLFSVAAFLNTFGDDYRFKTPVFATKKIENGKLHGNLILVAQGDLTMGGRQTDADTIAFTKLDHINANEVPGAILTEENPLNGMNELARQIYEKGLREITGDIQIDVTLFETIEKRGMVISPIMINENLIDIVINPTKIGEKAGLTWRPEVPGYMVENRIKTVAEDGVLAIEINSDKEGHHILVEGTIPADRHHILRTFSIKDPSFFARAAFIQALENQGIKINLVPEKPDQTQPLKSYDNFQQVALWTSPPLSEYAKLILKVSHNLGADLVPLWLASRQGKKTFDEGMRLLGNFVTEEVKISPDAFVFADAAGGNENRLTPRGEVQLLDFIHKKSPERFKNFFNALPIMGVDGSLEDFAKQTRSAGKVRAKTGTGVVMNSATGHFFLITQALAGYIEGRNDHLFAYMVVVNNGKMDEIEDIFAIFEDESQLSNMIYNHSN